MRAPIWVRRWCCALTVVLASCGEGTSGVAKAILATGSSSSPTSPMSESSSTATAARAEPTATGAFASTTATQVVSRPPCVVGSVTFNVPVGWSYLVEPAPSAPKPSPPYACGWLVPTEANGRAAFPETFGFDFIDSSRFGNGIDAVLQSILPKATVGQGATLQNIVESALRGSGAAGTVEMVGGVPTVVGDVTGFTLRQIRTDSTLVVLRVGYDDRFENVRREGLFVDMGAAGILEYYFAPGVPAAPTGSANAAAMLDQMALTIRPT